MKTKTLIKKINQGLILVLTVMALMVGQSVWAQTLSGSGTKADPYLINNVDDWNTFAKEGNWFTYWANGKHVKLNADIPTADDIAAGKSITAAVGSHSTYYSGTFNGGGHTLTLNLTGEGNFTAPFRTVSGATIKRLHTAGTITTGSSYTGGIIGQVRGTTNLEKCQSSVTINSTKNGDGCHGGLVGLVAESYELTITDCLFDGSITGSGTTMCGGFVGSKSTADATLTLTNCLMAGTLNIHLNNSSGTFNAGDTNTTFDNCYYKGTFSGATLQGTQTEATGSALQSLLGSAWEVMNADAVPIMRSGDLTNATISGIQEFYIYTGTPFEINYTVTDVDGVVLTKGTHYTESFSSSSIQEPGDYTLTVTGVTSEGYYNSKTFTFRVLLPLSGDGTQTNPWVINNVDDWVVFSMSNNYWASGKHVKLNADIPTADDIAAGRRVTTTISTSSTGDDCFQGTFYGGGHTITLALEHTGGGDAFIAPFKYVLDATIKRLHTAGTITTNGKMAGGIVGNSRGESTIQNCQSSVTISSSIDGDGTHGGLEGRVEYGTLTITDCLFDGSITGSSTNGCGGFVGWINNSKQLVLNNCLQAGDLTGLSSAGGATFCRYNSGSASATFNNCYYKTAHGTGDGSKPNQGKQTSATGSDLQEKLGDGWEVLDDKVVPFMRSSDLAHATVSGIQEIYFSTGSPIAINYTVTDIDGFVLTKGTDYTESFNPSTIQAAGDYTLTITGTGTASSGYYSSKTVTFRVYHSLSGTGIQTDPYVINNVDDWTVFAYNVNNSVTTYSDQFVKLNADIPTADDIAAGKSITTTIGTSSRNCFQGTFDGNGHMLTLNLEHSGGGDAFIAPFKYISGATIKRLHTAGTITTDGKMAGSIVGDCYGTSLIQNCHSSVTISSSVKGDGTHGGLVGRVQGGELAITGCLFDGELLTTNSTNSCGGFVGWRKDDSGVKLYISNSLFAPTNISIGTSGSATFCRNGATTITNSYYTTDFNDGEHYTGQGKQARTVTLNAGVAIAGTETTYNVSGLTAIGTNALSYGGTIYSGEGQTLTLDYTGGSESFTMPAMDVIPLLNGFDNSSVIAANQGSSKNVVLSGRTLTKDGNWNTLCLPFDVTIADSPLAGATVKKLNASNSNLTNGTLTLTFDEESTTMTAGTPYIIKWANGDNITNPTFTGVTITITTPTAVESSDGNVKFVGQYSPFSIDDENINEILYVASGNQIGYSSKARDLKCFRAHFWVKPNSDGSNGARSFVLDFGDGETTSMQNLTPALSKGEGAWYSLDGRKLNKQPSTKGVYIHNGRKVVMK